MKPRLHDTLAPERLADQLIAARASGGVVSELTDAPADLTSAIDVQQRVMADLGETAGGWKAAGLSAEGHPLISRLHRSVILVGGDRRAIVDGCILEVEFGFRLARDLPDDPTTGEHPLSAISEVCACFEICRSRAPWGTPLMALADGLSNELVVVGSSINVTTGLDLADRGAALSINGREVAVVTSGPDPTTVLRWFLAQPRPPEGLKAGDLIITGSLTGTTPIQPGDVARARIDGVGTVEFTAA